MGRLSGHHCSTWQDLVRCSICKDLGAPFPKENFHCSTSTLDYEFQLHAMLLMAARAYFRRDYARQFPVYAQRDDFD